MLTTDIMYYIHFFLGVIENLKDFLKSGVSVYIVLFLIKRSIIKFIIV